MTAYLPIPNKSEPVGGGGTVDGPGSNTDSALVLWDGVDGTLLKDSPVTMASDGRMTFVGLNNNTNSMNPTNIIEVFEASDIDDLATGGTVTISTDTFFMIKSDVTITSIFALENGARLNMSPLGGVADLTCSTTATFISGVGSFRGEGFLNIISADGPAGTAVLCDISGGTFNMTNGSMQGWSDLGTVTNSNFFLRFTPAINWGSGFKLVDNRVVTVFSSGSIASPANETLFTYSNRNTANASVEFVVIPGTLDATSSLLKLAPDIREDARIAVTSVTISDGILFDETGADGTFTGVADASIGATAIASVTDSSGVARFNYTGSTVYVNQEVVISGFTTNTAYNKTALITAAGAGFFEVYNTSFGSDETGSFLSNSATLTDTATTLVDGDGIVIDTDLSTDYDGGATVYNQLTNSFQINRSFLATESGNWTTRGLNQKNPKVLATNNPNYVASSHLAFAEMNGNTSASSVTDGTYGPLALTGVSQNSITERFKLVDLAVGRFKYIGKEPLVFVFTANIFATKSGSTQNYRFTVSVNEATPVFATAVYTPMEVRTTKVQASLSLPVSLVEGDTIDIMQAGDGTADDLTVTDLFITG